MLETKCDICNKKLSHADIIRVQEKGTGFKFFELCEDCGKPVTKFLIDKKLINNEKPNGKKTKK